MIHTENEILFSNINYKQLVPAKTQMYYKVFALSSRSQTQNNTSCMFPLIRRAEMIEIFYTFMTVLITEGVYLSNPLNIYIYEYNLKK